jgi:uncharacterized protein YraI
MGRKILPRLGLGALLSTVCAGALAQNAMITTSADLYAGPDDSYPQVAQIDSNTPVQVNGCLDDWSWCDVSFQDARGWVYSPDITYMYQGGYVPLYQYAPSLGIAVVPFSLDVYWGRYYQGRPFFAQRTQWEHRTINHRRPSGPPPHAGPPPRPAPGPREAGRPDDHSIHLGSAVPPHNEAPPHAVQGRPPVGPRPDQHAPALPTPQRDDHANGPGRAAPPSHEDRAKPMEAPKAAEQAKPPEHAAPPKDEDHPH